MQFACWPSRCLSWPCQQHPSRIGRNIYRLSTSGKSSNVCQSSNYLYRVAEIVWDAHTSSAPNPFRSILLLPRSHFIWPLNINSDFAGVSTMPHLTCPNLPEILTSFPSTVKNHFCDNIKTTGGRNVGCFSRKSASILVEQGKITILCQYNVQ